MAAVEEQASEFNLTPYVSAKASLASFGNKYFITLSGSISTYSPTVTVAVMALGDLLLTNVGAMDMEVRSLHTVDAVLSRGSLH